MVTERQGAVLAVGRIPENGRRLEARFGIADHDLLIADMNDGHYLDPAELPMAVAVANAWNADQHFPRLLVWGVRSPRPVLVGTCSVPLAVRITDEELAAVLDSWMKQAYRMFRWCHERFQL